MSLIVFARKYNHDGDIHELVMREDEQVGVWSPVEQKWIKIFGYGEDNEAFLFMLYLMKNRTPDGERIVNSLKNC